MNMKRGVRRFALTAHVTFSVGWLGAVAGFLALAATGITSDDAFTVRAVYLAAALIAWFVIVPLSILTPLTGLVMALGTRWGLLRHYWILIKLFITIFADFALVIHLQPISSAADIAGTRALSAADFGLQFQLTLASGIALLLFLVNMTLAVYKPQGLTQYGLRKQREQHAL